MLELKKNRFKGELPALIANLSTKLEELIIWENQISSKIPKDIGNLNGLTTLAIFTCNIIGEIPSSIRKLENLCELYLYKNRTLWPIPSSLGNILQLLFWFFIFQQFKWYDSPYHYNSFFSNIPRQLFSLSWVIELCLLVNFL